MESRSRATSERRNPANLDEIVGVRAAFDAGRNAGSRSRRLARLFPAGVTRPLQCAAACSTAPLLMEQQKEEIARLMTREEGKALKDALGEVQKSINILEFMAGEGRRIGRRNRAQRTAQEFRLHAQAAARGGCRDRSVEFSCVHSRMENCSGASVRKHSVLQTRYAHSLHWCEGGQVFEQAGVPAGVLNMIVGSGSQVGDELLQHPDVRAISFTGSNEVGSELYAQGARRMKKCQCEMGGKNPLVILGRR